MVAKTLVVVLILGATMGWQKLAVAQPSVATGQPFAAYWHPHTLLKWNPQSDPDAAYNRSGVRLVGRFHNPATQANSHARANEARVVALAAFGPTSFNPSQGSAEFHTYAVNYWQYMDVLVFWGGSAGEGLILAPKPTIIDAAHRNGVPVLGTIFLPPTAYGGRIEWVRDLVQKSGSTFPVADKLIEVANYFGFDGWFINQETAGGDAALAAELRDFLKYFKQRSRLRLMWYDAMNESGSVGWQGALNSANDLFFEDNGRSSDNMFIDFRWTPDKLSASRTLAQTLKRSPYDLYAGVDVEGAGYNKRVAWESIFPEGLPHNLSLGFYRPEWTFHNAKDAADFYWKDNRFWVGANRDPGNTLTNDAWKGVAHYIAEQSPINSLPFVTNFNTGQGHLYAINGQVLKRGDWNNLSLQDVLPTWRWSVQSNGDRLLPELDWSEAYYGGTSLKVSGQLSTPNHLKLFSTRLPVRGKTRLGITYKTGVRAAPTDMQVGLAFEDNPQHFEYLRIKPTNNAGWNTTSFNLGRHAGRTLSVISLRFQSDAPISNYAIHVGRIAVYEGRVDKPRAPSQLRVEKMWPIKANQMSLRLRWQHAAGPVYCYNVYRRKRDGSLIYLGGTPNNAFFVPNVEREATTTIAVQAVGPEFGHSKPATTRIHWRQP